MPVDPNMPYNGHNSFEVDVIQRSFPFGVEGHSHLTIHFSAWAISNLAEGLRGETRFINEDGMLLLKRSHTWAVPMTGFEKVVITQAIPTGAVQAQFEFLPNGTYWIVEPKGEFGEHASPFSINFSNQLSQIGPTGAYLGQIHSHQIIMTQGGGLDQYLSTWNARVLSFENRLTGATTHIDADGLYTGKVKADQIEGGVIRATSPVTYGPFTEADRTKVYNHLNGLGTLTNAERLKYDVNSDGVINITDLVIMTAMIDGRLDPVRTIKPVIRIEPQSLDFEGGIFFGNEDDVDSESSSFYMSGGVFSGREVNTSRGGIGMLETNRISGMNSSSYISFYNDYVWADKMEINNLEAYHIGTGDIKARDSGGIHFYDVASRQRVGIYDDGGFLVRDRNRERMNIYSDSRGMIMLDSAGRLRQAYDVNASYMVSPNGSHQLGVDNGGAYQVKSGVKSYL